MKNKTFAFFFLGLMTSLSASGDNLNSYLPPNPPIYLDQNWTDAERQSFYSTPQGSYLIPYSWFLALRAADTPFRFNDIDNIHRYGYLVDNYSPANPDHLPIGFAKEPVTNDDPWLGYTCAACHTNNIAFRGKTIRVDGAPTLADFKAFLDGLIASLNATLQEDERFSRFAGAVLGNPPDPGKLANLRGQVAKQTAWLTAYSQRNTPSHAWGAGRVDAFGVIMNELFSHDMGLPDNLRVPNAPVSYPFLWGTPRLDFVQWNGSASNPFGRNVGEVLGTYGNANLNITSPNFGENSARARELFELETLVAKLAKPKWPEALLAPSIRDAPFKASYSIRCRAAAEKAAPIAIPCRIARVIIRQRLRRIICSAFRSSKPI